MGWALSDRGEEQIKRDGEALRKSGVNADHVRKTEDNARRILDRALEQRERNAQRGR